MAARVVGAVDGSPVVADNLFFACEHPMAQNVTKAASSARYHGFGRSGRRSLTVASVVGVVPAGQLRRGFLYYLDRERARPYRPLVYYISWFDIA